MARDARGAMNDLPIPGQPDFDLNTMKLSQPDPNAMTRLPPAQAIPMLPSYANGPTDPKVAPTPPPMDQSDIDDLTNQRLMKIIAPDPNDPTYNATPVSAGSPPIAAGAGGGGSGGGGATVRPPTPAPPPPDTGEVGVPNTGIPSLKPGSTAQAGSSVGRERQQQADVIRNQINSGHLDPSIGQRQLEIIKGLPGGQDVDISVHPQADTGDGFDLKKWAIRLGIPLGVAALLFRKKLAGGAAELGKLFDLGGSEIAPEVSRAGEAGASEAGSVSARQADIDSGTIKPQDYAEGEKPKPGTEGYKQWFKYRQDLSKTASNPAKKQKKKPK